MPEETLECILGFLGHITQPRAPDDLFPPQLSVASAP